MSIFQRQQQALGKIEIPVPGANVWSFRLGDVVKDKISGFEGTAIERHFHLSGCDRFAVEFEKDGEFKSHTFPAERLELVEARPTFHRDEVPDYPATLGDKVKDIVTGADGIMTVLVVPLHGAMRVIFDPGYDTKAKKLIDAMVADAHMVEVIQPARKPEPVTAEPVAVAETPKKRPPGACRMPTSVRY